MRADIVAGAVFPDYELTDHAGRRRTLSELQGPDPMILVLSRGGYCPKDLRQAEGLVHLYREMSEHNPMIPHVIVLEPGLVVFKIYNGYWFFGRPTLEELRQDLRVVLRKCRPDWDITTPELKADWAKGEHGRFYPYGKTYGQVFREQE